MNVEPARPGEAVVGFIANPRSGHDIRRLVARASVFPNTEKVMMLQRVLTSLGAVGVQRVVVATDAGGIASGLAGAVEAHRPERDPPWPPVELLDLPLTGGAADSVAATDALVRLGAGVLVVLGGDGTDRLVASVCGEVPIVPLSTGTNNAFAQIGEATVSGLAAGLLAPPGAWPSPMLPAQQGPRRRARGPASSWPSSTWRPRRRRLSAPARCGTRARSPSCSSPSPIRAPSGSPRSRGSSDLSDGTSRSACASVLRPGARRQVLAPIAPGLVRRSGWTTVEVIRAGERRRIAGGRGVVAIDGERELEFRDTAPTVTLSLAGPWSLDVRTGDGGRGGARPPLPVDLRERGGA